MSMFGIQKHFCTPVFLQERPELLPDLKAISDEYLERLPKCVDNVYPAIMSDSFHHDARIAPVAKHISGLAWNMLDNQGYDMRNYSIGFTSAWTQKHYRTSGMEQHLHPGSHIISFYFLSAPADSSRMVLHDPRTCKMMFDLPEKNSMEVTDASNMINVIPTTGLLVMTNSWVSHSFTRNTSHEPLEFVHFNMTAVPKIGDSDRDIRAEVI